MRSSLLIAAFLAGLFAGIGLTGKTEELWISATVKSHHFDNDTKNYEQSNWGLGLEYEFRENWRAAIGMYRNSLRVNSLYMLACHFPWSYGPIKLGGCGGIVSGYQIEPEPAAIPVLA